ncbi:MAG TPA: FecR family protein [Burkholderiales bacterium]|nr:FecR family protein [Burkholderiales bacterium]
MKLLKLSLLLTILFALCGTVHAEVVGRVLIAAGDTSVIRHNQELRIAVGSPVEDQDTLKTGPASNMQVRFTDESVVSLRDQSLLKIDEYKFNGKQDGMEKAFFNLVKGGFRTITGLIGKVNKTNYGVKTATATIGIRGTNFALLYCSEGNCGVAAKNGLYGGVSGGIIAAKNRTGEYQYGSGDYFFIPSENEPAKKLIGPPDFLADHLPGQGRVEGRKVAFEGNERPEHGGIDWDGRPNRITQAPPQKKYIVTENLCDDGFTCVLLPPSPPPVTPSPAVLPAAGTNALELAWAAGSRTDVAQAFEANGDIITLSGSQMTLYCVTSTGCVTPFTVFDPGQKGTLGSGTVIDQGSTSIGNMFWGLWVPDPTTTFVTSTSFGSFSVPVPYIFGAPATSVPSSGTVNFTFAGGPSPVDGSGTLGTMTSGPLRVDFLNRAVGLAPGSTISLSFGTGAPSYTITTLSAGYAPSSTLITGTLSGTCSGGLCGPSTATNVSDRVSAHFTSSTSGLGIALAAAVTTTSTSAAFAAAYTCSKGTGPC